MKHLRTLRTLIFLVPVLALFLPVLNAQTFRGAISGTVTDQSGAVVPGAQVIAVETATNTTYKAATSSAGDFAFAEMPLGSYTITIAATGFKTIKVEKVPVTAGTTYALPVKLVVASSGETVTVTADQLAIDTVSDQQTTVLPELAVQNIPNSGRDFTQMLAQTTGFTGFSTGGGAGNGAVNGSRSNNVNWQIEGTDNNDLWWNEPAVNQGGVSAIPGVILPIDSIENFSFVSSGTVELGRNSGGTANVIMKSGSNNLHGSGYYYNHNEFFQATNPVTGVKLKTRDLHYGYSVGGPIWHDKTFFFLGGEYEHFVIGAGNTATEPSTAYQNLAYQLLDFYGIPHNSVSSNLLNGSGSYAGLWPSSLLTGPATAPNYISTANETGHSYNGLIHLDHSLTDRDHLSFVWFIGQGTQQAPTNSQDYYYFENAPIHVQNFSLVYNRVISPNITNQLSAGVSYFNQVFSDANTNFNLQGLGLDTGVTSPALAGAPNIKISAVGGNNGLTASGAGFDPIGITPNSGRNDTTGHLDENLAWTKGAHEMKFGGEYRQAQVDDFYQTGQRGTIYFDGSQGPWSGNTGSSCAALATQNLGQTPGFNYDLNSTYLADFLAGCYDPSSSSIILGDPKRMVYINTFSLYAQDTWKLQKRLSLNYGVRYDYEGPLHTGKQDLSVFDPSIANTGLAVVGKDVSNLYNKFWGGISPRIGFSYQLDDAGKSVLRGGYGFYYDSIYLKSILQNNSLQNISVFGPELNPAGANEVVQATGNASTIIAPGVPVFENYTQALSNQATATGVSLSNFDRNFRPSYTQSIDLNIQQSISSNVIFQVGYVGNHATHLMGIFDINPAQPGTALFNNPNATRPYYGQFQQYGVIDTAKSSLNSNYNSLQTSLRLQSWRGLSASLGYTWGHALDYETGLLPYLPQNPLNEKAEYGNSDFDERQNFTGYVDYIVPKFRGPERLSKGWEFSSDFSFHGGLPFTVLSATNPSNNGEYADRAFQIGNPYQGISHKLVAPSGGNPGYVQWFNPASFTDYGPSTPNQQSYVCADTITPYVCDPGQSYTYSPQRRGQFNNPGYSAVDLTVIKNTKVVRDVNLQFRADLFNVFNRMNLAPVGYPGAYLGSGGAIGSTIGPYLGNPGIGPGEPFNAVFAVKVQF